MATQFELAMKRLDNYAKTQRDYAPLYDFRLEDGTPVREYANFIQVGYKLIPKTTSPATIVVCRKKKRLSLITLLLW